MSTCDIPALGVSRPTKARSGSRLPAAEDRGEAVCRRLLGALGFPRVEVSTRQPGYAGGAADAANYTCSERLATPKSSALSTTQRISYGQLLKYFRGGTIRPEGSTGDDVGTQYRSNARSTTPSADCHRLHDSLRRPELLTRIVTTIEPLEAFFAGDITTTMRNQPGSPTSSSYRCRRLAGW
jgi:hypothetical protein